MMESPQTTNTEKLLGIPDRYKKRPRRLRKSAQLRALVSETFVDQEHLVMPIFVKEGDRIREKIDAMPGIFRYSPDEELEKEIGEISDLGIKAVLLFGLP